MTVYHRAQYSSHFVNNNKDLNIKNGFKDAM